MHLAVSASNPEHDQLMSCQLTTRADQLCDQMQFVLK